MRNTPSSPARSTLVERDAELRALTELVATAAGGRGGSARVLGPAGVGKTALVRALAGTATAAGARSWITSAGQLETRVPFGVARRLLDRSVRNLTAKQRAAIAGGPARLALTQLWEHEPDRTDVPSQGDMLHSLGWLLEDLVGNEPLLIAVDDAQWADEESLLFLGSLRETLADLPLAVVVAARDESIDRAPTLSALVADRDAIVLRLEPLSGAGISVVLGEHWADVPTGTADAVLDVTGGNPFLVHALADALGDDATPVAPDQVHAAVPDSVVDLMVARLAGLPDAEQALARAVAVFESATLPDAATLSGLAPDVAALAADHLRRAGLLADGSGLVFRHALLRNAVHSVIGTDTRDALHRSAARLLAPTDPARAAAHVLTTTGTGDAWAVDVLRAAAAEAMALGAPQSAVALLARAVAEPPVPEVLADVLADLGLARMRTFDPECIATLREALDLTTDPVALVQRALTLAAAYAFTGRHDEGAELLDEILAQLGHQDRELMLTVTAAWAAIALLIPARVAEARERLSGFAGLSGETPGERLVIVQQLNIAAGTNQPADVIRSLIERVIGDWRTPEQFPESGDWVWPRLFLGRIGEYDAVRLLTDAGIAHSESTGSIVGLIAAHFVRGMTEADAGDLPTAELHFRAMVAHHDGGLLIQMLGHAGLAETLARQGRTDEAAEIVASFPDALPPGTASTAEALVWLARATVANAAGDHARALDAAEGLHALLGRLGTDSPTWIPWRPLAIEPLRALGRLPEARALAAEYLTRCETGGITHLIGEALSISATLREDPEDAIATARRAADVLSGSASRIRAGTAELTLGSLLRRQGNKLEAREHLRTAVEILSGCGAAGAAYAEQELAATGVRITRADPRRLTPSEARVAALAIEGLGNRDIAARLHVSRKTVETHLSAVYRKLDLAGRDALTAEHLG